ncbi:hypothetical protein MDIS_02285 [Mesomycoplasma dispar]|nr:hypothetical protein MDIS_02285 [Mesomycoplasma dispar]
MKRMLKNGTFFLNCAKFSLLLAFFGLIVSIFENFIYYFYLRSLNFFNFVVLNGLSVLLFFIILFFVFLPKIAPIFWKNSLLKDVRFQKDVCNFWQKNNKIYFILTIFTFFTLIIFNLYNLISYAISYYSFGVVFGCFFSLLALKFRISANCYSIQK